MNAYTDYLADTAPAPDQPRILAAMASVLRQMHGALKRNADSVRLRRTASDLEHLDDKLLKDVGLRREHFPSGTTRILPH